MIYQGDIIYKMFPFFIKGGFIMSVLNLSSSELDALYCNLLQALEFQTVVVKFQKKDGSTRVMLGTRNKMTVQQICNTDLSGMLLGFDKKANIENRNIPVVDLALGEVRTFCVSRLEGYQLLGIISNVNSEAAFEYYNQILEDVESQIKKEIEDKKKSGSLIDLI